MTRDDSPGPNADAAPGSEAFWADYYEGICRDGPQWLDYSNERVHLQTFGAVIEASDRLLGRRVLDVGCGRGLFCRVAKELGASSITGIDQVESAMSALAAQHPDMTFRAGDIGKEDFRRSLGRFDNVYLLEVLQYLPAPAVFDWVWEMVEPGGIVVAVFPNEKDPLVQKTVARFEGKYAPPSLDVFATWAGATPDLTTWAVRGFRFQQDQRIVPYEIGSWTRDPAWVDPPNRVQLVARKAAVGG